MRLPLKTASDAVECALELGFLPVLDCEIEGYSLFGMASPEIEGFRGEDCVWEWRCALAQSPDILYGKYFHGKVGAISAEWFPDFANMRRGGMDFAELYENGKIRRGAKSVMDCFEEEKCIPSWILTRRVPDKNAIADLERRTFLTVDSFQRKRGMRGGEYGWAAALYTTPEAKLGEDFLDRRKFDAPEQSRAGILAHMRRILPNANEKALLRLLVAP